MCLWFGSPLRKTPGFFQGALRQDLLAESIMTCYPQQGQYEFSCRGAFGIGWKKRQ